MTRLSSLHRPLSLVILTIAAAVLTAVGARAQDEKRPTPTPGVVSPPAVRAATSALKSGPAVPGDLTPAAPAPVVAVLKKPALTPMMSEVMTLLATQDGKLAALAERQKHATAPDEALAVQKEIQALKLGTEVSLMRIQANYARREGRAHDAARLEAAIESLVSPPRVLAPADRAIPARTDSPQR